MKERNIREIRLQVRIIKITFHFISFRFNQALYPFEVVCIKPCRTIAGPTERILTRIPISIKPPSIPKMDDKKAVAKVAIMMIRKIKSTSIVV